MELKSQVEVEAKFSVTSDTVVPDLTTIMGVEQIVSTKVHHLSAVYYDTEDLRLTRSKITLRRRTGGTDDGWHIKFPGKTGRLEIHHPIDYGTKIPEEIHSMVRSIVRDEPLSPIAQVDNERHETLLGDAAGTVVAEFCDDHVSATSLKSDTATSWREWEVEVTPAAPSTLIAAATEVLTRAGAAASKSPSKLAMALGSDLPTEPMIDNNLDPNSPTTGVIAALKRNRDKLLAYDPRVRRDEWDSIHQMRVATRELRSHLQSFAGILAGTHHKDVSEELKHLAATLGVARDAEVIAERFKDLCDQHPSGIIDAASSKQLHDDMLAEYAAAHQKVVAALNDDRYLRLLDELDELITHPQELADPDPTPASTHVLLEQLRKSYKRLMKLHNKAMSDWDGRSALRPQQEHKFHNVRKAAKKLRYTTEAVGDATDIPTGQLYRACKQLQEVLGNFQDSITSREKLLAKSHEAFHRGENTFIYGVLYETEVELSRNIMQDYPAAMAAVTQAYQRL